MSHFVALTMRANFLTNNFILLPKRTYCIYCLSKQTKILYKKNAVVWWIYEQFKDEEWKHNSKFPVKYVNQDSHGSWYMYGNIHTIEFPMLWPESPMPYHRKWCVTFKPKIASCKHGMYVRYWFILVHLLLNPIGNERAVTHKYLLW